MGTALIVMVGLFAAARTPAAVIRPHVLYSGCDGARSGPSGAQPVGAACEIQASLVQKLLATPGELSRSVRLEPKAIGGLRLISVRPGSCLYRLGLRSGDRLRAINRIPLGDVDQMLLLYVQLRPSACISLEIQRGGHRHTLDYRLR